MGTRASIKVKDGSDEFFLYQGHDGYPENVEKFIEQSITKFQKNRYGRDIDWFTTNLFMDLNEESICTMITSCIHGDEEYHYLVEYDETIKKWKYRGYD